MQRRTPTHGGLLAAALLLAGCTFDVASDPQGAAADGAAGVGRPVCVPQPVAAPLQRLTQLQYQSTVRALLRLPADTVVDVNLPADERVGPFAANTQAPAGDLTVMQYQTSAIAHAQAAMQQLPALLPCEPAALDRACAAQFVDNFGQRAFRRPLTAEEHGRYVQLASTYGATDGNNIRLVVQAFLQSPNFLYRLELGDPGVASDAGMPLTPYELASRLSFLFWNSGPDDALLAAAAANQLGDADGRMAQIERLVADDRMVDGLTAFVRSLVGTESFGGTLKDSAVYPLYTPALQAALQQETRDFVAYTLRHGQGTLAELLTSSKSVLGDPLSAYYGVGPAGDAAAGTPVALDANQRAGILTRGAFLGIHGHAKASGPVPRGRAIRENLFCQKMPAPPVGVSVIPPAPKPGSTTRQLLLAHESNPSCAACHLLMDHIGFGLENFDGIGAWRATDSGQPVDASGDIIATPASNGDFNGPVELSKLLAASPDVRACVALQMYRYGLGRQETDADACSITSLQGQFAASGGNFRQLMVNIATSPAFAHLPTAASSS